MRAGNRATTGITDFPTRTTRRQHDDESARAKQIITQIEQELYEATLDDVPDLRPWPAARRSRPPCPAPDGGSWTASVTASASAPSVPEVLRRLRVGPRVLLGSSHSGRRGGADVR